MNAERLLATFLDLVRISTPSGSERACAEYCASALEAAGCSVRYDESATVTGSDTGNLIAELPGEAPALLALSAHLDMVDPCEGIEPVVRDGIISSAGPTILGADDRAGLAAAIECVRSIAESGERHPTIKLLFTVEEEIGLQGAKALTATDAASDLCLVMDAAGTPGGIIIGAPTHYSFSARFLGKASHAGVVPEQGISAIRMAADAVMRMRLGRLDAETTANVGTIKGGTATNVVAPSAELTGECRSLDVATVERVRDEMDSAMKDAAAAAGGSVEIIWHLEYGGFRLSEDDEAVLLVAAACRDIGIEPWTATTGGGSDANVLSALGVPTLALCCGMQGVHGTSEQIAVADLEAITRIAMAVSQRLAGR